MLPACLEKFTKINIIEEGLEILCIYGKPLMWLGDSGWICMIEMFVTGKGIDFKIKSEYFKTDLRDAINNCCERLKEALQSLEK